MEAPEAVKAQLTELGQNLHKITSDLEPRIKAGEQAGQGVAELKSEVAKLSERNAALDAEIKKAYEEATNRQDEFEIKMKDLASQGGRGAVKTAGEAFVESDVFKSAPNRRETGYFHVSRDQAMQGAIKAVTLSTGTTPPRYIGEAVIPPNVALTMRDLIPGGRSAEASLIYPKLTTRATAAAMVAPGGEKPESSLAFTDATATMRKIAHYIVVNEEQLSDFDQLRSIIDAELEYGIRKKEDEQLLNGNNTGQNLDGILPNATAYANATYGDTVANVQRLDHVLGMMAQLEVAGYVPDGIVMHPADWFKAVTTKTTTGQYQIANAQGVTGRNLWGLPVAVTTQITSGEALVGAFRVGAQLFDGQLMGNYGVWIKVGTINEQFIHNQLSIIGEERLTLQVKRPDAFVTGDLVTPGD